jgi:hypothetical protein
MKLLRLLFLICTMQSFGAIAQSNELPEKFSTGELRYDCIWGCNFQFDYSRGTFNQLYRNSDWKGLVKKVNEIGLKSRTSYFFLFKAAEQLKFYDAAQVYLDLAKADILDMGCFAINKLDICKEFPNINSISVYKRSAETKVENEGSLMSSAQSPLVGANNLQINKIDQPQIETFKIDQANAPNQTGSVTALQPDNSERERLLAEVELERKKRQELEEQLRVAQQTSQSTNLSSSLPIMTNRRALVIGNDTYKSVPKLANAREDARTIATNLTSSGYQVTLRLDLTEKEMKAALRTFAGQVQGGDEVLFFFAGHGVQLGATNYLLPIDIVGDSEAQVKDEAIQLQRVLDDMSEKKAKFTLAMVDACRDNPFKSTGRAIGGRGLAPTTAATGQMVIFSAGTGQQALDKLNSSDKNKNGLFTRVFALEMQKPNLSIDRVVKNVRNQVAQLAKSVGHDQVPAIYDQVLGDFYFKVSK